jgi:hypothetical protein
MPPLGKAGCIRLLLCQGIATKAFNSTPSAVGSKKASCFSAVEAGKRLKPVRIMGSAFANSPAFHGRSYLFGSFARNGFTIIYGIDNALVSIVR